MTRLDQTPKETHARLVASASRGLRRALGRLDIEQGAVARYCDVAPQTVQKWCESTKHQVPNIVRAAMSPRPVAMAIASWILEEHHAIVVSELEVNADHTRDGDVKRMLGAADDILQTATRAVHHALVSAADRIVTPSEARTVIARIDEARRALLSVRGVMARIVESGQPLRLLQGGKGDAA